MILDRLCENCGALGRHHGIDSSADDAPLMCPLYMKNDHSNWDGNYHKWRKWKPMPNREEVETPFVKVIPLWMKVAAAFLLLIIIDVVVFAMVYTVNETLIRGDNAIHQWEQNRRHTTIEFQ